VVRTLGSSVGVMGFTGACGGVAIRAVFSCTIVLAASACFICSIRSSLVIQNPPDRIVTQPLAGDLLRGGSTDILGCDLPETGKSLMVS